MKEKVYPKRFEKEEAGIYVNHPSLLEDYPCHWHDFYELEYVRQGSCVNVINDERYPLKTGDMLFCTTADIHAVEIEDICRVSTVHFDERFLTETSKKIIHSLNSRVFSFDNETSKNIKDIIFYIGSVINSANKNKNEIIKNRIETLLLYCAEVDNKAPTKRNSIMETIGYIDNNFREGITLEKVANISGFSRGAFSRAFHSITGVTFQEYIIKKRLKWAAALLKSTDLNITQIAYNSGFHSHSHFSNIFKKNYGVSPADFRAQHTKKA